MYANIIHTHNTQTFVKGSRPLVRACSADALNIGLCIYTHIHIKYMYVCIYMYVHTNTNTLIPGLTALGRERATHIYWCTKIYLYTRTHTHIYIPGLTARGGSAYALHIYTPTYTHISLGLRCRARESGAYKLYTHTNIYCNTLQHTATHWKYRLDIIHTHTYIYLGLLPSGARE